jgi:hypothetical protein
MRYYKNGGIRYVQKGLPMQKCDCLKQYFSDYLEKQLDSPNTALIEQHLHDCTDCHATLKQMKLIKNNLCQLKPLKTSSDFDTVLHTRIRLESSLERRSWFPRSVGWSIKAPIYAASFSVILLVSILIYGELNQPPKNNLSPMSFMMPDSHFANTKGLNQEKYELDVFTPPKNSLQNVTSVPSELVKSDKSDTTQDKQNPNSQPPQNMMIHNTNYTF